MKALFAGAGLALSAGLLLGASMKPDLTADDRPAGPQIFTEAEPGSTGPFDDGGMMLARYGAKAPDYVLGTDWTRATSPYLLTAAPARYEDADRESLKEAAELTRLAYADDAPGYAEQAPAPRAPDIDDEAPPEATGDTSVAADG